MTTLDMIDSAILKLTLARDSLAAGNLAMAHFDLSRAHIALHEADAVVISSILATPTPGPTRPLLEGALR